MSAFAFGSGALFAKPVYAEGVGWHVLMAWRFLVGAVARWRGCSSTARPRAGRARRMRPARRRRRDRRSGVLYTGNSATYFAGLETVSASLAALIVYIYPAIVAVISLQVGQPLRGRRAWGALALALAGVALAVGNIDDASAPPLSGLVLMVASPIIYAVWIVLAARLSGEGRGDGVDAAVPERGAAVDPMAAGRGDALRDGRDVLAQRARARPAGPAGADSGRRLVRARRDRRRLDVHRGPGLLRAAPTASAPPGRRS